MLGLRLGLRGRCAVLVVGCALGLGAGPADAVLEEAAFAELRSDLEHRVANELATPADKASKKQRKAVDKCLKALDKKSTKLSTDMKTALRCAGFVAKPFAEELVTTGKLADFGDLLNGLAMALRGRLDDGLAQLSDRTEGLDAKSMKKVQKQLDKAYAAIDAAVDAGSNYKKKFAKLGAGARALEKGVKIADKAVLKGKAKADQVVMTLDGEKWVSAAGQILTLFYTVDDGLQLQGKRNRADGGTDELVISIAPVPGPGRYPLADADNVVITYTEKPSGGPNVVYTALTDRGEIVLDEANLDKPIYRARFYFTLRNAGAGDKEVTNGASNAGAGNILGQSILFF